MNNKNLTFFTWLIESSLFQGKEALPFIALLANSRHPGRPVPLNTSQATGRKAPLPGGKIVTVFIRARRVVTLVLMTRVTRMDGLSVKPAWKTASWLNPIRVPRNCIVIRMISAIPILLTVMCGVKAPVTAKAAALSLRHRRVNSQRCASVNNHST